jgi:hypothetical protein
MFSTDAKFVNIFDPHMIESMDAEPADTMANCIYWGLKSGPQACSAGALPLEPHLQPCLCVRYFQKIESPKLFAWVDFVL